MRSGAVLLTLMATNSTFPPSPQYFLLNSMIRSSYPSATGQWLQVTQITTTSLFFMSSSEQVLPSVHSRPAKLGASAPIFSGSARTATANPITPTRLNRIFTLLITLSPQWFKSGLEYHLLLADVPAGCPIQTDYTLLKQTRGMGSFLLTAMRSHARHALYTQLLHHRPHRPRQEHPRGSIPAQDRHDHGPRLPRPDPRRHGPGART